MDSVHETVLLNETIENLDLKAGSLVIDGTFGGGGHSALICKKFPDVKIVAIDQDKGAFEKAKPKFENLKCKIKFLNTNFRKMDEAGEPANAIILDLGLSSDQLDNSRRGFSFKKDEPLLMTMKEDPTETDLTARVVVNTFSEKSLADIIFAYGEERYARRIARKIVEARIQKPIETTSDLVKIIESSVPGNYKHGKIHFATRTFQAIRIAVNDEYGALSEGLQKGFDILRKDGRMAVISFHSGEDRIVKRFFKQKESEEEALLITKKPITPSEEEIINNNRARSAKLRVIQKII